MSKDVVDTIEVKPEGLYGFSDAVNESLWNIIHHPEWTGEQTVTVLQSDGSKVSAIRVECYKYEDGKREFRLHLVAP